MMRLAGRALAAAGLPPAVFPRAVAAYVHRHREARR